VISGGAALAVLLTTLSMSSAIADSTPVGTTEVGDTEVGPDEGLPSGAPSHPDAEVTTSEAIVPSGVRALTGACGSAPSGAFPDVLSTDVHRAGIDCLAWWRVAGGFADGRYRPGAEVTRGQMASFLTATILASGGTLPPPAGGFRDPIGTTHRRAIERLAAAGIVGGFGDGTYRPGDPVTRGQMAAFLDRTLQYRRGTPLPEGEVVFPDVGGTTHEAAIGRVAAAGVTGGDTSGNFRPGGPVTRGQMGSFLARALAVLVDDGTPVRASAAAIDREALRTELCPSSGGDTSRADRVLDGYYTWAPHPEVRLGTDLTWREDPLSDSNWRFQFHALRWLWPLIDASHRDLGDRYLERAQTVAKDWVTDNPVSSPASPMAWYDHAAAWRALVLGCLSMQQPTPPVWLAGSLTTHRDMLADPSFYVAYGNHALNQDSGLLAVACLGESWDHRDLAVERIARLAVRHVDAQGLTDEQAIEYQYYNYERYQAAIRLMEACGIRPPSRLDRVQAMPGVLAHMTLPDGTYETLGDTDRRVARNLDDPAVQYVRTRGEAGIAPDRTFAIFDAGFVFARTGWGTQRDFRDEAMLSGRFGPQPIHHGHHDHGAITLYAQRQRLLTDPGKYAYGTSAERQHAVSRTAHNVVTIGPDCTVPDDPSSLGGAASDATTDRFTVYVRTCRGTKWTRTVVFVRGTGEVVVVDDTVGPADAAVVQRWQLEPGATVSTARRDHVTAVWPGGASLLVEQLTPVVSATAATGARAPMRGWVSERYNSYTPAPNLQFTAPAGTTARFVTVLRPGAGAFEVAPSRLTTTSTSSRVTLTTATDEIVTVELPRR
jgi:hypothetical protein